MSWDTTTLACGGSGRRRSFTGVNSCLLSASLVLQDVAKRRQHEIAKSIFGEIFCSAYCGLAVPGGNADRLAAVDFPGDCYWYRTSLPDHNLLLKPCMPKHYHPNPTHAAPP